MERIQKSLISKDLTKKMVFIVGPRQVGKTWLAQEIAKDYSNSLYLNYDHREDRDIIHSESWLPTTDLLILDEIHKMKDWKNFLKGVDDTSPEKLQILVTGSARLDIFRQSGDSLAGRYFLHHLLPFSYKESSLGKKFPIDHLMERGGFPEPVLAETPEDAIRWRNQYAESLIRYDILDFENIHDLRAIQLLFHLLRSRVGSPVSCKSISEDIGKSPNTIKKYIQILEALFIVFRITPYARNISRSLRKEPKLYFYDTGLVQGDEGVRFENFIAVSLLKHLSFVHDIKGTITQLHYLRTKERQEVDFCLVINGQAKLMVEAKHSDSTASRHLHYFNKRFDIPGVQVVRYLKKEHVSGNITVRKAESFLLELKA